MRLLRWFQSLPLLADLWTYDYSWCYDRMLETYIQGGKLKSECSFPSGIAKSTRASLSVKVGQYALSFRCEKRWGGEKPNVPTRQFLQEFTVTGKKKKFRCIEATAELPIYRRCISVSLTSAAQKAALWEEKWLHEVKCKMVLRQCRDTGWYHAKVSMGKHTGGPGWILVPKEKVEDTREDVLNWTDWHEEYRVKWSPW